MSKQLIQVKENEVVTTSLLVAEKFNKNHKNVIVKIESLISEIEVGLKLSRSLFHKSEYLDAYNRPQPMYYINRDGLSLLVMGFTGKEALEWKLKYIDAFNKMEKKLLSSPTPTLKDDRLEIAKLIVKVPRYKLPTIKELYPEYFKDSPEVGSLEYASDINTAYMKWKDDFDISIDWISSFPTTEIYNHYVRYCVENKSPNMGKKTFYRYLEYDFNLKPKQKGDGHRYFLVV